MYLRLAPPGFRFLSFPAFANSPFSNGGVAGSPSSGHASGSARPEAMMCGLDEYAGFRDNILGPYGSST